MAYENLLHIPCYMFDISDGLSLMWIHVPLPPPIYDVLNTLVAVSRTLPTTNDNGKEK